MKLTSRQLEIIKIVKENEPISGDSIAGTLGLSRATLRSDLAILTMTGLLDARPKVGYFYTGQTIEPLLYEKLYKKTVEDILLPPILIHQGTTVYDAVTNLFMYDVGSLYVKDDSDELIGVLSRKDLLRAAISNPNTEKTPVAMIMSRMPNIITITKDRTILEAGGLLLQHSIDTLPVVEIDNPKKVIGKVTKSRIMAYFINAGNEIEKENY
ncbi:MULTISPECIES: helix-turn-helix transcriptional regulator [unclassified Enterococcus]|uniref:helix-turn-helix transcriptional regulator n=1 Tax=unclassified Enterococcus TaxID=2608891 RepID=UPI001CE0A93D|nr:MULTISPECIES: helix-turn-helix transcriptional regulator [unclassified Enterococcus]MCA5012522.1 helix-turn-helix transcriptional regulator [Enterococcus sp. S23]MCA5015773.1 helix-turn-helix transcriptional regulator [Enterococcus sp. S22(2020)]